jgi:hypothetical protein
MFRSQTDSMKKMAGAPIKNPPNADGVVRRQYSEA